MVKSQRSAVEGSSVTDALIGAAAGALGVWVLDRLDWFMWKRESPETRRQTTAARPNGEPPAHVVAGKVEEAIGVDAPAHNDVGQRIEHLETKGLWKDPHYAAGAAVHYGLGVGPGAIYSVVQEKIPLPGPVRGALYGLTLFVSQDELANTVSGLAGKPRQYPWQAHARGLFQHIAYGIVTDAAITFAKRQLRSA